VIKQTLGNRWLAERENSYTITMISWYLNEILMGF
jgi:hypothetical protein